MVRATLHARAPITLADYGAARRRGDSAGLRALDECAAGAGEDGAQHPPLSRDVAGSHAIPGKAPRLRASLSGALRLAMLQGSLGAARRREVRLDPHEGLVAAVVPALIVGHSLNVGQRLNLGCRCGVVHRWTQRWRRTARRVDLARRCISHMGPHTWRREGCVTHHGERRNARGVAPRLDSHRVARGCLAFGGWWGTHNA